MTKPQPTWYLADVQEMLDAGLVMLRPGERVLFRMLDRDNFLVRGPQGQCALSLGQCKQHLKSLRDGSGKPVVGAVEQEKSYPFGWLA